MMLGENKAKQPEELARSCRLREFSAYEMANVIDYVRSLSILKANKYNQYMHYFGWLLSVWIESEIDVRSNVMNFKMSHTSAWSHPSGTWNIESYFVSVY